MPSAQDRHEQLAIDPDRGIEELLTEIRTLREEINQGVTRLYGLARLLQGRARRAGGEMGPRYSLYATAWMRFAGAVSQGLRRAASSDRMLRQPEPQPERLRIVKPPPPEPTVEAVSLDDLIEFYGAETVKHVSQ